MPRDLDPVQSGDLITAELMNDVLNCLAELDRRVTKLEAGVIDDGSVIILRRVPAGSVTVGNELQVFGRNFQYSIGAHRVFLNDFRVRTFVPGSNDELLVFAIPNLPDLPSGGVVTLTVSNQTTSDSTEIHILPADIVLDGNIDLGYQSSTPSTPTAGNPIQFNYRLFSRLNQTADIELTPAITGVTDPTDWESRMQILDAAGGLITGGVIRLEPLQEALFSIGLTSIPTGADGDSFTVELSASADGVSSLPLTNDFIVGDEAEQQDETFSFEFQGSTPASAVQEGVIGLAEGGAASITLFADFTLAGFYDVSETIVEGDNWTVERNAFNTPATYEVTADHLGNPAARRRTPEFIVRANPGAAASGQVRFTIQRQGATVSRSVEMPLSLV